MELDPQNFRTLFFRSFLAFHAHGEGSQNEQVETDLRRSIAFNANFPPAYGLLASYLAGKRTTSSNDALGFAKKAIELEPGTSVVIKLIWAKFSYGCIAIPKLSRPACAPT